MIFALFAFILLLLSELAYFFVAQKLNIIDKPNNRSSHKILTIRGGGILFPLAFIIGIILYQSTLIYLAIGVFLIGLISFLDDVLTLKNSIRLSVHFVSVFIILYQLIIILPNFNSLSISLLAIFFLLLTIFIIGIINVCNFMDGINGMLGVYFLANVATLYYIQESANVNLLNSNIWQILILSIIVFGIFNFRKVAKTFSGDVGSISLALIFCYLLLSLIIQTNELKYVLMFAVYGIDAVGTIFCRFVRNENIFQAHRSHFYQFLANHLKIPHIKISLIYAFAQMCINILLISNSNSIIAICGFFIVLIVYIILRLKLEGRKALFNTYPY